METPAETARYWQALDGGHVRCTLCPRRCTIAEGRSGNCLVRRNRNGSMHLPLWGMISSIAMDPIEKKPLRGFMPGSSTFSVGFWGCNMDCPFCQNHDISHPADSAEAYDAIGRESMRIEPEALIRAALDSGAPSISYTYSEPAIHAEYVGACMELAHANGLRNVLVTNGFIAEEAGLDLLARCDAANVDLKSADPEIYRGELGGRLDAVRAFIALAAPRTHLEVTTLLVPGVSDSLEGMRDTARFLAGLNPVPALHLTGYHPDFRMRRAPLAPRDMRALADEARMVLPVVYSYA